jgi:fatty-acyl-CoA synthase
MGLSVSSHGAVAPTGSFRPGPGVVVLADDGKVIPAGSDDEGVLAIAGAGADAYYKDPEKSAGTFRVVDGVRYTVPGDHARINADGSIELLGRGSQCINTGGEKVFPEEVEEAIKAVPGIDDCLVFGEADERFGQRVVGVASRTAGAHVGVADVLALAQGHVATYKLPRQLLLVDAVPRTATGKADYPAARRLFEVEAAVPD